MDDAELAKLGVVGGRAGLHRLLRSKPYDILMIFLIIVYTILIFLYFSVENTAFADRAKKAFYIVEITILGIFSLEITLHVIALRFIYLRDYWNIFDIFIIILSILFVLLDIFVKSRAL